MLEKIEGLCSFYLFLDKLDIIDAITSLYLFTVSDNLGFLQNGVIGPMKVIKDIQSILLVLMCNVANKYLCKKSSGLGISDENLQGQICYFVDAAIAFCKLQHLSPSVPIKTQVWHKSCFFKMLTLTSHGPIYCFKFFDVIL